MTSEGVLEWAVKDSFLEYVRALDDGTVSVAEGAREVDNSFAFPAAETTEPSVLRFTGRVALRGHAFLLAVDVVDPWIELEGMQGRLTVAGPRPGAARFTVARLDTVLHDDSPDGRRWTVEKPLLTSEGAYWLGGYYAEGSVLAPLVAQILA